MYVLVALLDNPRPTLNTFCRTQSTFGVVTDDFLHRRTLQIEGERQSPDAGFESEFHSFQVSQLLELKLPNVSLKVFALRSCEEPMSVLASI